MPSIAELLQARAKNQAAPLPAPVQATPPPPAPHHTPLEKNIVDAPAGQKIQFTDKETVKVFDEKMIALQSQAKERETAQLASAVGLPTIILKGFPISPEALTQIPEDDARQLSAIVFYFDGKDLRLATTKPDSPEIKELLFSLGERLKVRANLYVVSEESLNHAFKLYETLPKIKPLTKGIQITEKDLAAYATTMNDVKTVAETLKKANATDILAIVIAASLKLRSSDVHIEAEEKGIIVRFRVDGMLQEIAVLEREQWKKLINRIKLVASLKINVTDQAQDGRFTIFQQNTQIDVRLSTIPTAYGESVVMRLLTPDSISLELGALGFRPAVAKKLEREISRPNGMIVTTGPTGSGKTTTLYAILKKLNTADVKIITLEDPIEYKVSGINQSQIDHTKDYTFAKGLRSILRQDPDIVMVGEIRDLETAEIAIQAALTGHLLLSTIHTNDAAGALPRFVSMGVTPHLLAPALNAILGQRLIRKLCEACKKETTLSPEKLTLIKEHLSKISPNSGEVAPDLNALKFYAAAGCDKCNNTGYKGRIGVYEVLIKDAAVEKAVLSGAISEYDIREIAKTQGMVTMAEDGLLKALDGLTTVDEVERIVGL
jgi:type II secretory ATPase GspE/PulE/Tfp pilus assembly ATPase PilB-like protein